MPDPISTLTNTFVLLGTASFMIIIAFLCTTLSFSKLPASRQGLIAKLTIGAVLGFLAIYATVMAIKLPDGTIPNVRELAAMIAGVTGGPIAGLLAGLIGGIHRFSLSGVTAVPCGLATVLVGTIAGLVSTRLVGKMYWVKAALLGFVLESLAMGLVFVFVPFDTALSVVSQVYVPMVAASTIGLALWTFLLNKLEIQR